jgi:hypothetical protein
LDTDPEIKAILIDILKWTKFQGMQKAKQILETTLDNDIKRLIYSLSDGESSPNIAKTVGIDPVKVRRYWKKWFVLGIVEVHPKYNKRYQKIFTLNEFGIKVPEVQSQSEVESE